MKLPCALAGLVILLTLSTSLRGDVLTKGRTAVKQQFIKDQGLPWFWSIAANLESLHNQGGGLRDGTGNSHLLSATFAMNGDVLGLPRGGRLKFSAISVGSDEPSAHLIGDTQVVSNIAAANATRIYEFWYRQQFAHVPLRWRAGLIDLNQHFDSMDSASALSNSSFGISPALAGNGPMSIYPEPGWGAMARWQWAAWQVQGGVFSGRPDDRSRPLSGRPMALLEFDSRGSQVSEGQRWMLGLWRVPDSHGEMQHGAYVAVEQPVDEATTLFAHLGHTPGAHVADAQAVAAGFDMEGPFPSRPDDRFSFGITRVSIDGAPGDETSYEATYIFSLNDVIELQPDVQYVAHPSGILPSTWVFGLRLSLGLDRHMFMPD